MLTFLCFYQGVIRIDRPTPNITLENVPDCEIFIRDLSDLFRSPYLDYISSSRITVGRKNIYPEKMGNVYKVIEIQGKSLGCVATQDIPKGTLILVEKPQIVLDHNYGIQIMFQSLRKNVCDGFFSMSKDDVEEYLNLANSYKKENELNERMKEKLEMFKNCGMSGRLLEIMEIYESNCWSDGLGIKMAR